MENVSLLRVFHKEDFEDLKKRLNEATAPDSVVNAIYRLQVNGKPRCYKAAIRLLWVREEALEMIGTIGKFLNVYEKHVALDTFKKWRYKIY